MSVFNKIYYSGLFCNRLDFSLLTKRIDQYLRPKFGLLQPQGTKFLENIPCCTFMMINLIFVRNWKPRLTCAFPILVVLYLWIKLCFGWLPVRCFILRFLFDIIFLFLCPSITLLWSDFSRIQFVCLCRFDRLNNVSFIQFYIIGFLANENQNNYLKIRTCELWYRKFINIKVCNRTTKTLWIVSSCHSNQHTTCPVFNKIHKIMLTFPETVSASNRSC